VTEPTRSHGDWKFRILGPLEISVGGERLDLGGSRQQIVIATLLLNAGRLVTTDRLLEAIYGEDLPPTSRSQAQISISSLRRVFGKHDRTGIISTSSQGYIIHLEPGELDAEQFEGLVTAARRAREEHHAKEAVAMYRDALRLWRGPAFEGMESELVRAAATRLDEQRITVNEERVDLELDMGRHHELVSELSELVHEHPLRERLRGQLMLALYRCDRAAEALQVYRQTRQIMIDELGLEPGQTLQQLEHAILTSDPSLDLAEDEPVVIPQQQQRRRVTPSLLPTDIADFTGRVEQLDEVRAHLLREDEEGPGSAVPVLVIVGKGGVGKTALALHAAHRLIGHFADGQLFADLHGSMMSQMVGPAQVLERFLRVLGVPSSQIPEGLDERAEVYRSMLAGQRVLVVLDDARAESQVRPLLPGSAHAAVIITSRTRLVGLPGAVHIELDVFDPAKSLDLLARVAGSTRIQSQPEAAAAVAAACGHLPLALRIAGARLSARPHWSVNHLLERLADETRRLDELNHGDMGIRSSISLTYDSVGEEARQLLRRLALLDTPVFSDWLGAALLDQPLAGAENLLEELVSARLIETTGTAADVNPHYRFHDLIRVFARERLAAEEPAAERKAALERALGALLYMAEEAHIRYYGGEYLRLPSDASRWRLPERSVDPLFADPLTWYDHERVTLVCGVRQAAHAGLVDQCWTLALTAVTLFESRAYFDDWGETHSIALEAARKTHNIAGEAAILYSIGTLHMEQQRLDEAREEFGLAAQLFRDTGDDQGVGLVIRHLAYMNRLAGQFDEAITHYEQALAIFSRTGDQVATAYVLQNLAQVRIELGQVDDAKALLSEAQRLSHGASCPRIEAQVLHRLGEAHLLAGEPAAAVGTLEAALVMTREIGDTIGLAHVLRAIGTAHIRQGNLDQARTALQDALKVARSCDARLAEAHALLGLSELALASGDAAQAVVAGRQASHIFAEVGAPVYEARALDILDRAGGLLNNGNGADGMAATAARNNGGHSETCNEEPIVLSEIRNRVSRQVGV
jgi:DNA-binding SARP family transcriptional activator/predicted negative regulator of RcsB-dependent stress response